jgi:hypothetical protein
MNRSLNLRNYDDARETIEDGSLLLFRGAGLVSEAIETAGRSPYSHAALAGWLRRTPRNRGVLMCVEVREGVGARAVNLSSQVAKFPDCIDVYRPTNEFRKAVNLDRVVTEMFRLTGQEYGYRSVLRAALSYVPGIRWLVKRDFGNPTHVNGALDCSGSIAWVFDVYGEAVLCPNTEHEHVTPGDLGRCPFFGYECTLTYEPARCWHE